MHPTRSFDRSWQRLTLSIADERRAPNVGTTVRQSHARSVGRLWPLDPIGIQTFAQIRDGDHHYVDMTGYALRLIDQGKYDFLSRPRRSGKSLFLGTLAELIAGNEPLFRGLDVHARWDWSRRHPVIRLSFGGGVLHERAVLDERIGAPSSPSMSST